MRNILLLFVVAFSLAAHAEMAPLTEEFFFNTYEDVWEIQNMEMVFYDEIIDEAIYAVSFSYVTEWDCATAGDIDYCGPKNDEALVETCEYYKWNGEYKELEETGVNCSESVDVLIDEKLFDEY